MHQIAEKGDSRKLVSRNMNKTRALRGVKKSLEGF
jgi:hypothetical protein